MGSFERKTGGGGGSSSKKLRGQGAKRKAPIRGLDRNFEEERDFDPGPPSYFQTTRANPTAFPTAGMEADAKATEKQRVGEVFRAAMLDMIAESRTGKTTHPLESRPSVEQRDKEMAKILSESKATSKAKGGMISTKRYMNGGMVMSGRGVRDTKIS